MQARLLPHDQQADHLINYTAGIITRHYEYDGSKYYFSLFPEISGGPGHSLSGRYLAVLMSVKGFEQFYIESDGEGNYTIDKSEVDNGEVESTEPEAPAPIMEIVKDAAAEPVENTSTADELTMAPVIKMALPTPGIDMIIEDPATDKPTSEYYGIYDDEPSPFLSYKAFDQESGILNLMSIAIAQWKENN